MDRNGGEVVEGGARGIQSGRYSIPKMSCPRVVLTHTAMLAPSTTSKNAWMVRDDEAS